MMHPEESESAESLIQEEKKDAQDIYNATIVAFRDKEIATVYKVLRYHWEMGCFVRELIVDSRRYGHKYPESFGRDMHPEHPYKHGYLLQLFRFAQQCTEAELNGLVEARVTWVEVRELFRLEEQEYNEAMDAFRKCQGPPADVVNQRLPLLERILARRAAPSILRPPQSSLPSPAAAPRKRRSSLGVSFKSVARLFTEASKRVDEYTDAGREKPLSAEAIYAKDLAEIGLQALRRKLEEALAYDSEQADAAN